MARWFGRARPLDGDRPAVRARPRTVCWRRPDEGEALDGYGVADAIASPAVESLDALARSHIHWLGDAPPLVGPWFGGAAFDRERGRAAEWARFGASRWILPEVIVARHGGRGFAAAFVRARDEAAAAGALDALLDDVGGPAGAERRSAPVAARVEDSPRRAWDAAVDSALARIAAGTLAKVVLARRLRVRFEGAPDVERVVDALAGRNPGCATFAISDGADGWFVGASPEMLLGLEGRALRADALAGTLAPGSSGPSEKEVREHAFVVQGVLEALSPVASRVSAAPARLLTLPHVAHLRTPVEATLAEGVGLGEVVARLHPTPAVGGTPRLEALAAIRELEDFDRGWYAGAVGWVGPGRAHLRVAIRSALLRGDAAFVYAGAGIVRGSSPEREWDETARKSRAVLDALEAA